MLYWNYYNSSQISLKREAYLSFVKLFQKFAVSKDSVFGRTPQSAKHPILRAAERGTNILSYKKQFERGEPAASGSPQSNLRF